MMENKCFCSFRHSLSRSALGYDQAASLARNASLAGGILGEPKLGSPNRGHGGEAPRNDTLARPPNRRQGTKRPKKPDQALLRSDVRRRDTPIDREGRARDIRRLVRRQEQRGLGDLARLAEAADRDMH